MNQIRGRGDHLGMACGLSLTTALLSLGLTLNGTQPPIQRPSQGSALKIARDTQAPQAFAEPPVLTEPEAPELAPGPDPAASETAASPETLATDAPPAPTLQPATPSESVQLVAPSPSASDEGALPSYASVPESSFSAVGAANPEAPRDLVAPPLSVPRDGRGMMAVAGLGLAGSTILLVSSAALAISEPDSGLVAPSAVVGGLGLLAGSLLMASGSKRHKKYRRWQRDRGEQVPSQGFGLAGSGGALLTGGAIAGVVGTTFIIVDLRSAGTTLVGLALGSLAVGAGLTVAGVKRNKKFKRWQSQANYPGIALSPSLAPMRGGAQIGLSGRF